MHGELITPPYRPLTWGRTIFLAGPIQGAANWHKKAIQEIWSIKPWINIACPKRDIDQSTFDYGEQVDWETHHLRHAAGNGAILFWLAKEDVHFCDRAYAQTSRFELGEWFKSHHVVIGIQAGFSGEQYLRHRLLDYPNIPVATNLEETCLEAIKACTRSAYKL